MLVMIFLLSSALLAATRLRMEKTRNASETERVPSAESFLPVKGQALTNCKIKVGFRQYDRWFFCFKAQDTAQYKPVKSFRIDPVNKPVNKNPGKVHSRKKAHHE
jgi:hypothetical protein